MRILVLFLLLAACSQEETAPPAAERKLYAGEGRDRLCMNGDRVGFVAYGQGDTNCSVRGRLVRSGGQQMVAVPDGDRECRIELSEQPGGMRLGAMTQACAYYCGPGASISGKAFTENASASPAVDFAGDPLC